MKRPFDGAIDATPQLERTLSPRYARASISSRPCSTACRCRHRRQRDGLVQWANQPMDRLVPRARVYSAVVETIRDP